MLFRVRHSMDRMLARGIDINAPGGIELFTEVLMHELPGCTGWSYHHILDELTVDVAASNDVEIAEVISKLSAYGDVILD